MEKQQKGGVVQAGEIPTMKRLAKKFAPPTAAQQNFIEAAALIYEAPDSVERAFMAPQLVLCTLPHSDPGNVPVWSRKTGGATLSVQTGFDEDNQSIGFPYGSIPRLVLFWITTATG